VVISTPATAAMASAAAAAIKRGCRFIAGLLPFRMIYL
jgi:hypothetical protein